VIADGVHHAMLGIAASTTSLSPAGGKTSRSARTPEIIYGTAL
jgi:hypothetical protein